MTSRVVLPSWLIVMWPELKVYMSTMCPAASDEEFIDKLVRVLIKEHPITLNQAMKIIDKVCQHALVSKPESIIQRQRHIIPLKRLVSGSIDLTMNDLDPGLGYGHFYAPVDDWYYKPF